jgi:hypothetical protein
MNVYGLTIPTAATGPKMRAFVEQLDKLRRSEGSQAVLRSKRQTTRDLATGKRIAGCRVDPKEQEQLRRDRGQRKSQRRRDRKAGIRV